MTDDENYKPHSVSTCRHCGVAIRYGFGDSDWDWIHLEPDGRDGLFECEDENGDAEP